MNRKIKALAAAIMVAAAAFTAGAEEKGAPREIDVQHYKIHKRLFDIPIEIVPRAGYNFTKTENGVADAKKHMAFSASEIHMPYERLMEELSPESLKKNNMEIKARYSFIWNGREAELIKIFQSGAKNVVGKWTLIINRGFNTCWMLTGSYDAKNSNAGVAVVETIKTAWWPEDEELFNIAASGTLTAQVDTEGTPFRIAGFRQDSLVYTKDGEIPTAHPDKALYVISSMAGPYVPPEQRISYANKYLAEVERGAKLDVISQTQETLDGYPSVVTVAYTGDESHTLIYQAAVYRSSKVTMLVGISKDNSAENLEYFHMLTATYREQ